VCARAYVRVRTSVFPYTYHTWLITSKLLKRFNLDHVENYEIVVNYVVELTTILTMISLKFMLI